MKTIIFSSFVLIASLCFVSVRQSQKIEGLQKAVLIHNDEIRGLSENDVGLSRILKTNLQIIQRGFAK